MKRGVATVAVTALALISAAPASAVIIEPTVTASVTVAAAYWVPDDVEVAELPAPRFERFTVVAPAAGLEAAVQRKVEEVSARLQVSPDPIAGGGATTNRTNTVFGTCGSSYVSLNSTASYEQGQGYVEAGFTLTGVSNTGAYVTDVMIYSNAGSDLWTDHLRASGNLKGKTSWSKGSRVTVPSTQDYGAHFYVGTVAVTKGGKQGACRTLGPRVDDVPLYTN